MRRAKVHAVWTVVLFPPRLNCTIYLPCCALSTRSVAVVPSCAEFRMWFPLFTFFLATQTETGTNRLDSLLVLYTLLAWGPALARFLLSFRRSKQFRVREGIGQAGSGGLASFRARRKNRTASRAHRARFQFGIERNVSAAPVMSTAFQKPDWSVNKMICFCTFVSTNGL